MKISCARQLQIEFIDLDIQFKRCKDANSVSENHTHIQFIQKLMAILRNNGVHRNNLLPRTGTEQKTLYSNANAIWGG